MRRNLSRRAGSSKADGGSSWISYSDMMAALLLLFVLVLCYSMYQSLSAIEVKTAELDEQTALVSAQQTTLDEQEARLASLQIQLDSQQSELDAARLTLADQQSQLDAQTLALSQKQEELDSTALALNSRQEELDAAKLSLAQREAELAETKATVDEQQALLSSQQQKLDDLVGVRTKIVRDLTTSLSANEINATVDSNTGDIMLESAVFFEYGKNVLTESGKAFLRKFVPVYLSVLLSDDNQEYLGEIIIEGHTDSAGSYLTNLKLSQERALSVANYCLSMDELSSAQKELLQSILTVTGKSYSSLIYNEDGTENADASRRVEFKFRLKDTEMIDEIRGILSGGEGD